MIIRNQTNDTIVSIKDDFIIYDGISYEVDDLHVIAVKTGLQAQPVFLGTFLNGETVQRVITEIYEAYNNGYSYTVKPEEFY